MRPFLCCVAVCLLAPSPVHADERAPGSPSAAEQVRQAWADGRIQALAALAREDVPDPWRVADELCRLGAHDAALAFARAAVRPDTARLAAYLERRGNRAPDTRVRAAIGDGGAPETQAEAASTLAKVEALLGSGDEYERTLLEVARGNALSVLERYAEAAEAFLSAGRLAESLGWLSVAASAYKVSGDAAYERGKLEAMLTAWEGWLGVEQGRENEEDTAEALLLVGLVHVELGDPEQGQVYLSESLAANEAIGNDDGIAWVLNNLATIHNRRGEHQLEQAALERALRLARKVGNKIRVAAVLCDQGGMYCTLYDHSRARAALRESMALHHELGDEAGVVQCQSTMGLTYHREGDFDKAIQYYEDAVAYYRKVKDAAFTCATLNSLGYAYFEKGDLDRAQEIEEEAVRVGEEVSDPWWGAHARQSLAEVLLAKKQYTEAERQLDRSMAVARRLAAPTLLMYAHRGRATMWIETGKYARAVHESKLAMEFAQAMLSGLAHEQAVRVRDKVTPLYDVALRAAVAWGPPRAVFSAMESARAGALLEVLENRAEIRAAQIPETLRNEEREAKLASLLALREYQKAVETGVRRDVRKQRAVMERARENVRQVVGRIQRAAKRPASVLYPVAATLEDVQGELEARDALVLYSLVGKDALALVVTKGGARTAPLGPRDAIVAAAGTRPDEPDAEHVAASQALRDKLVEPLGLPEDTDRLLVSPDGVLGFTPFSLLLPDTEVVFVPSGTAYRVLRGTRSSGGEGVLALGDPDYQLPLPSGDEVAVRGGIRLVPLPATREEAQGVGDVLLLGKGASKSALLAALAKRDRWEAVHLACHGLVDPARPSQSALALAFEADGGNLLSCEEVFTLRVPADLTVLSACETGRGAVHRSEGIVGLAQAFMLAGSPRVLVSLWKVEDRATQALMLEFYRAWRPKDGRPALSAAAALKRAQAHVRAQAGWEHPYYWAAWVLWGLP